MNTPTLIGLAVLCAVIAWLIYEMRHPMEEPKNGPDGSFPRDEDGYTSK